MNKVAAIAALSLSVSAATLLWAHEGSEVHSHSNDHSSHAEHGAPAFPMSQEEHTWLEKFVGEWETNTEATMEGPNGEKMTFSGTISSRMLGGFWVINESTLNVPGGAMNAIQTIGYNAEKKKYVGTWVDSAINHLWYYEGTIDESGNTLSLVGEGPNFMNHGKLGTFRDAYEFTSADRILITSALLGDDGKWITFMTGEATRKQ